MTSLLTKRIDWTCPKCGISVRNVPDPGPNGFVHKCRPKGFGDSVSNLLEIVGIRKTEGCGCEERQEILNKMMPYDRPKIRKRNCIYHVYPSKDNLAWFWNCMRLIQHADVFNGKKVVAISTDGTTEGYRDVAAILRPHGFKTIEFANDSYLREVVSFLPLLCHVQSEEEDEATFYAHTKGNSTKDNRTGAMYWRNVAYRELLGNYENCMKKLRKYACVGIHKMKYQSGSQVYPSRLPYGQWMLAGTFFWFRHDMVFSHPCWRNVPVDRYGAEAWLSGLLHEKHAHSVYQLWDENLFPAPSPYDPDIYPTGDRIEDPS